jgi:hypothetical protein
MFIIKHKHQFTVNSEIHNINTRQHSNLHQPAPNMTRFKLGIYYSGVKIYNNLPLHIKQLADDPRTFELKFKKKLSVFPLIILGRILPTPILILIGNYNNLKYGIRKQKLYEGKSEGNNIFIAAYHYSHCIPTYFYDFNAILKTNPCHYQFNYILIWNVFISLKSSFIIV